MFGLFSEFLRLYIGREHVHMLCICRTKLTHCRSRLTCDVSTLLHMTQFWLKIKINNIMGNATESHLLNEFNYVFFQLSNIEIYW